MSTNRFFLAYSLLQWSNSDRFRLCGVRLARAQRAGWFEVKFFFRSLASQHPRSSHLLHSQRSGVRLLFRKRRFRGLSDRRLLRNRGRLPGSFWFRFSRNDYVLRSRLSGKSRAAKQYDENLFQHQKRLFYRTPRRMTSAEFPELKTLRT